MLSSFFRYLALGIALSSLSGCMTGGETERQADRAKAMAYSEFRADSVTVHQPAGGRPPGSAINSANYFAHFDNHVTVSPNVETRMGRYTFFNTYTRGGRVIQVAREGQTVISEAIPAVFYMGDLQVAAMNIGGREYLMFAANARAGTNRRWFGIYRADGTRLYGTVLERPIAYVRQDRDGVSLFFYRGDSMRISFY